MKKEIPKLAQAENNDMRPEYDFRGAERGKHYKSLHEGYTVYIHQPDGSTVVEHYKLEEGAVMLQPDVREYFPDSDAVNAALRSLIALMSQMPDAKALAHKPHKAGSKKRLAPSRSKPVKA
jgi:hypothetical protein